MTTDIHVINAAGETVVALSVAQRFVSAGRMDVLCAVFTRGLQEAALKGADLKGLSFRPAPAPN